MPLITRSVEFDFLVDLFEEGGFAEEIVCAKHHANLANSLADSNGLRRFRVPLRNDDYLNLGLRELL